jgi:hypothetical protein
VATSKVLPIGPDTYMISTASDVFGCGPHPEIRSAEQATA